MKTVIEMVKESGGQVWSDKSASLHKSELERFAELVRADEREACAKLADDTDPVWYSIGAAIRARSNK